MSIISNSPPPSQTAKNSNIFSFIETLPKESKEALYSDLLRGPYAARSILQRISSIGRTIVLRLVACGGSFPFLDVQSWFIKSCIANHIPHALEELVRFCIIQEMNHTSTAVVTLTQYFYKAIQTSLTNIQDSSSPWSPLTQEQLSSLIQKESSQQQIQPVCPTVEDLETFTQRRWDSVLHYLVGSEDTTFDDPPTAIILFLEQTGLMQEDPDYIKSSNNNNHGNGDNNTTTTTPPLIITSRGYEFMLYDLHSQVWLFIVQYFERILSTRKEQYQQSVVEAILFLLSLSYCKIGCAYPAAALSKETRGLIKDFSQFGLLYLTKLGGMTLFYPTRVAITLVLATLESSEQQEDLPQGRQQGLQPGGSLTATRALETALSSPIPSKNHVAIIVQTNFQVVAYTASPLYLSMLGLFCDVSNIRKLPNVIFYRITRDSIKGAFKLGIQAKQILRFLRMHAHPRLRVDGDQPLIPSNVVDQIILWDRERTRVSFQEVFTLQCQDEAEYTSVKQWTIEHDFFGWGSKTSRKLMLKYDAVDTVMDFVRRWRIESNKKV